MFVCFVFDLRMVLLFCEQAALRKICSVCGAEGIRPIDHQQLVELQLMDSFLICSNTDEDFVWTVQGNLLTHCCFVVVFICSNTDEDFVWTVQGNLLTHCVFFKLFFYLFTHRWGLWTVHGNLLTHCCFVVVFTCSHTDEDFEQFMATCWLIVFFVLFLSVHTQMRTLNSSWQLVDSLFKKKICSHADKDFVRTVQGNLLTHFCLFVFVLSVHTQMRTLFEQFKATCWLFFLNQFSRRWGLWTVQGHFLTHFFSISSHTDEDFA